jgi:hypothetical protein
MLEVVVIIGGAVIAFLAMVLWANNAHLKSEHETEI